MDDRSIEDTTWVLTHLIDDTGDLQPSLEGVRATLEAADGRVFGSASCNRFFGAGSLTDIPDMFGMTMMMCPEPVMEQERRYLALLPLIADLTCEGDVMTATNAEGTTILTWIADDAHA